MTEARNEEFEELPFEEQCRIVYEAPFAQKGDLVVRSQDPVRLVNSFAAEELYLMAREMDRTNIPELIQYATVAQLQFMADFECWTNEGVSDRGFLTWLEHLEEAGLEKLREWLLSVDRSMLIAAFQKSVGVIKPDHEETVDDIVGGRPYVTIDGLYYVIIDEDNMETVRRALETLFESDKTAYYEILEGVISEAETLVEEDAFQHRQVRLTDRGFPEKERAMVIYRPLAPGEWEKDARRTAPSPGKSAAPAGPLVTLPARWREDKLLFDDALAALADADHETQRTVYQELVWLSNKVVVAGGIMSFSERTVTKAFDHVRAMLNIALEDLAGTDTSRAAAALGQYWIEMLFRRAVTRIREVRASAEEVTKTAQANGIRDVVTFLGDPLGIVLRGLLKAYSQWYDVTAPVSEAHMMDGHMYPLRDFRAIDEVRHAGRMVDMAAVVLKLAALPPLRFDTARDGSELAAHEVTIMTVLMTAFAQFVLKKKIAVRPVTKPEMERFLRDAFDIAPLGAMRSIKAALKAAFIATIERDMMPAAELARMRAVIDRAFQTAEDELGLLDPRKPVQPAYVQCVMMK